MTIIYKPSGESKDVEIERFSDVTEITDSFNEMEQKQYKSFIFCNMSQEEYEIVFRKYLHGLSMRIGIPIKDLDKDIKSRKDIYIPEVGIIYMR